MSLSLSFICKTRFFWTLPDLTLSNFWQVLETRIHAHYWQGRLGALLYGYIYYASWLILCSALFFLPLLGWISISILEAPSTYSPFGSPLCVLWVTNGGEIGPWESKLPVAEGASAQITAKFSSHVPVEVLILILFSPFGEESELNCG